MKEPIAVALSGGVDSLVAAYLLKNQGYRLIGIHFVTGFEIQKHLSSPPKDPLTMGKEKTALIAEQLQIPVHVVDIRKEFKESVIDYFIREYGSGRTPNPCLVCNPHIKFDIVLKKAELFGAVRLATGHYAKTIIDPEGRHRLFRGDDPAKDQSYFLAFLSAFQLSRACFPLGRMLKTDVLAMAEKCCLVPAIAAESQDICFIRGSSYGEFLSEQPGFEPKPGPIVDVHGTLLGRHPGLHLYTVGQRRGINLPARAPYYVVRIEPEANRLVVGFEEDLPVPECRVSGINWIIEPPAEPIHVQVQIRYRHHAVGAVATPVNRNRAILRFDAPQTAVTPGQGAVFYQKNEVLGGGWIDNRS